MNPYETLGVDVTASQSDIKKAYRKLAIENHPDKGGDVNVFQNIKDAYEILKDTTSREYYDTHGKTDTKRNDEQSRVIAKIMLHIQNWLTLPPSMGPNPVDYVKNGLKQELQTLEGERQKARLTIERVNSVKEKLKTDGDNFIGAFFDTKIDEAEYFFIKADVENNLIDKALEMMTDYSWKEMEYLMIGGNGATVSMEWK